MTPAPPLFLSGLFLDPDILEIVLGHAPAPVPAALEDHALVSSGRPDDPPRLVTLANARVDGVLLAGASEADLERLTFAAGNAPLADVKVTRGDGAHAARAFLAAKAGDTVPWDAEAWLKGDAPAWRGAVSELMSQFGRMPPEAAWVLFPQMLARGTSAVRAATEPAPATHRRATPASDIVVRDQRQPYQGYFAVAEADLRFPLFQGGMSGEVTRSAFRSADAVTLLPYDPATDHVLLIEQFRVGPYFRGDPLPFMLEPVAGRIDPGETPEDAARREAVEEAGVEIGALHEVARYYPSPGAVSEWFVSYVGTADLSGRSGHVGGLASEAEDILSHVIPFPDLMALCASGEAAVGPLILSAYWLQANRESLRGAA